MSFSSSLIEFLIKSEEIFINSKEILINSDGRAIGPEENFIARDQKLTRFARDSIARDGPESTAHGPQPTAHDPKVAHAVVVAAGEDRAKPGPFH